MQHLPVPATGAAHPLGGWYHRGSPPSLHARIGYWPAKWGRSQNAAVNSHFPHHFILQNLEENGLMFRTLYIVKLDHPGLFFNHLCIRTLQFFFRCFLHGPCERENALHIFALHQHLTKM